jgi:transposase-like protein
LANEKIESYVWLFNTFLTSMGGVPPHLIITDEDMIMKAAITKILPDTSHRLCVWHIMDKVPEKVGPALREDQDFWDRLNSCVWGSETREEFESNWSSFINDFISLIMNGSPQVFDSRILDSGVLYGHTSSRSP